MKNKGYNKSTLIAEGFIASMMILAAVWQLIAPLWSDDMYYVREIVDGERVINGFTGTELITTWDMAWSSVKEHAYAYNNRLANFIMLLSNLLPRWLVKVSHGVMIGLMLPLIAMCARRSRKGYKSAVTVVAASVMMWTLLPWWDNMQSVDYLFNYAWTSVMFLTTIYVMRNCQSELNRGWYLAYLGLALLTAWMHEGFGLPLLGVAGLIWLGDIHNKRKLGLVIALTIGSALVVFGPGTIERLGKDMEITDDVGMKIYVYFMARAFTSLAPWGVLAAAVAIGAARKGWRVTWEAVKDEWVWIVMGVISFVMGYVLLRMGRVYWVMDLCVIVASLGVMIKTWRPVKWVKVSSTAIGAVMMLAFMVNLCYWQAYYRPEQDEMLSLIKKTGHKAFYLQHNPNEDAPWTTLGIVHRYNGQDYCAHFYMSIFNFTTRYDYMATMPVEYLGKPFEEWPKVPGDNRFRGVYPLLYSTDSLDITMKVKQGAPLRSMHPADWMLYKLKGSPAEGVTLPVQARPVRDIDGKVIYQYFMDLVPRTMKQREFVSVDEIEE